MKLTKVLFWRCPTTLVTEAWEMMEGCRYRCACDKPHIRTPEEFIDNYKGVNENGVFTKKEKTRRS